MKKYSLLTLFSLLVMATACNDNYNNQFDLDYSATDVKNLAFTLSSSDYAQIAGNETNKAIAAAKDEAGGNGSTALAAVGTDKYFTGDATADEYLPAFLNAKYPNADFGSVFTVTYNQYQAPATYLNDFTNMSIYTLSSNDYKTIWGDKVEASFLSPSSVGKVASLLGENITDAAEGDMVVVNYAYSEVEPSIGGGSSSSEPTWTELSVPVRASGNSFNFVNIGPVDLSAYKGETVNIAFKYSSTTASAPTWELKNFRASSVPYQDVLLFAEQADGTYSRVLTSKGFTGAGKYVIAALGADGNYYPFGRLSDDNKIDGYIYPNAMTVADGTINAADAADYIIEVGQSETGYTLKNALGKYIYQSGTYDGFKFSDAIGDSGYDWSITSTGGADLFTITNLAVEKSVKLNYYKGSYSYGSYAASKVDGTVYLANSMADDSGFTVSDVDLGGLTYVWSHDADYGYWKGSAFVNKTSYAAESYLVSPSIEIAEDATLPYFTIDEAINYGAVSAVSYWVSTDYSTSAAGLRALTRASATANTSVLYRYDGSQWNVYSNDDVQVAVVEPSVYTSLGATSISAPDEVLPIYLASHYPYAAVGDRVAVVYNKSANTPAVLEFTKGASGWAETSDTVETTTTFSKDASGEISSKISVYLDESLLGNDGGFTTEDVTLTGGLSYVWSNTATYGWKGSSYVNSIKNEAESWLVSPALDFSKGTEPVLTFDEAVNYLNGANVNDYCAVKISTNYKDKVGNAAWTDLTLETRAEGTSYDFINVGNVSLKEYIGNVVRIAFVYKVPANSEVAPTWEVKNVLVKEVDAE